MIRQTNSVPTMTLPVKPSSNCICWPPSSLAVSSGAFAGGFKYHRAARSFVRVRVWVFVPMMPRGHVSFVVCGPHPPAPPPQAGEGSRTRKGRSSLDFSPLPSRGRGRGWGPSLTAPARPPLSRPPAARPAAFRFHCRRRRSPCSARADPPSRSARSGTACGRRSGSGG